MAKMVSMVKKLAAIIAFSISAVGLTPAMAEGDSAKGILMIPVKAVAFATGAVIGTPIAVLRKTAENEKDMANSLAQKDSNPLLLGVAGAVVLPLALFKGGLEGLYLGTANSWKNSSEKPFSAESFSLGEMADK